MSLRIFKVALFTIALAVVAQAQSTNVSKIAVINSNAFLDEKAGITKFLAGVKIINAEFAPVQTEIEGMTTRLQTLSKEIDTMRTNPVVDPKSAQAKIDQAEKLQRDIKFKAEDAKSRYERRQQTQLGPVQEAIAKGLQDYAKAKGYTLIFDVAKDTNGLLIAIGDLSADVTKDFITFYNAKP